AAYFGDFLEVSRRRNNRPERRAAQWFEHKRCCRALGFGNRLLEFGHVLLSAVVTTVGAIEFAAVAVRHAHMSEFLHHGQVHFAALAVARDRQGTERGSVVTLLAAEHLVAIGLSDLDLVLA